MTDETAEIQNWLTCKGPRCTSVAELVDGFCRQLRSAGLPIERASAGAPLLHPVAQSSYVGWDLKNGAKQNWFIWTPDRLEELHASPIHPVYTRGEDVHVDLTVQADRDRFPIGEELWQEGFTDYHAITLKFSDGSNKVFTAATRQAGGFSNEELGMLKSVLPLMTLVFEGFIARNTAQTLMETYVGKRAGLRVLDGQISRGDGAHIDAVIWFSDLRGFTSLAQQGSAAETLELLNRYLMLVSEAIEANGGEILKYIGDAVLAIFPHGNDVSAAVAQAEAAAFSALSLHNGSNSGFDFGIALHTGSVFYGNIGGGTRLDFTVIGSAVNLASRIEQLCTELDEPLLVSENFVQLSRCRWHCAGQHKLKGVDHPQPVFSPVGGEHQ